MKHVLLLAVVAVIWALHERALAEATVVLPVAVEDQSEDGWGAALAHELREEVARSSRYRLETRGDRVVIVVTGGTVHNVRGGGPGTGALCVLICFYETGGTVPRLPHRLISHQMLGWDHAKSDPRYAAKRILGGMDRTFRESFP